MRMQTIDERVDNEITLLKAMPQDCLKKYVNVRDGGLMSNLHDFPGTRKHSHTACWLERYAMLHQLPFWGDTAHHLEAAGLDHLRANWLQNEVYHLNDHGVIKTLLSSEESKSKITASAVEAENAMRQLIHERIIAAEALASKPNVCSMVETEEMELVTA